MEKQRKSEGKTKKSLSPDSAPDPNATWFVDGMAITPEEQQNACELLRAIGELNPTAAKIAGTVKLARMTIARASPR
jgi:hypothetical protein